AMAVPRWTRPNDWSYHFANLMRGCGSGAMSGTEIARRGISARGAERRRVWGSLAAAAPLLALPLAGIAQDAGLEEIIVTAQMRTERLQDVPVSISVFNDSAIEQTGVRGLKEMAS